jgi:signal transduction histidine kinase
VILVGSKLLVTGDRDKIDQVVYNLLDNAIKFVGASGFIRIKTRIKGDRVVVVSIFNNGMGIPKEEIKYIWERFHKVDKARSKGEGIGLGLSIARQIINQHGQTIWVESCNEWTELFFTLNLSKF